MVTDHPYQNRLNLASLGEEVSLRQYLVRGEQPQPAYLAPVYGGAGLSNLAVNFDAARAEIPELVDLKHVFVKAAARLNNQAENIYQPTRERVR
jgi:hypothetical protein